MKTFSGITSHSVTFTSDTLEFILNTDSITDMPFSVPIIDNKLIIDDLCRDELFYIADLIDMGDVLSILSDNNIDYIYICDTDEYKQMDQWDWNQMNMLESDYELI